MTITCSRQALVAIARKSERMMSGRGGANLCTTGDEVMAAMAVNIPAELAYGEGGGDESVTFAMWRVRNGHGGEKLLRVCMTRDRLHALELGMVIPEDDE